MGKLKRGWRYRNKLALLRTCAAGLGKPLCRLVPEHIPLPFAHTLYIGNKSIVLHYRDPALELPQPLLIGVSAL